jgi:hypothetical protein
MSGKPNRKNEELITQEYLKSILKYDPETGDFTRLISPTNTVNIGDIAGYVDRKGYVVIAINNIDYRAHRLAWLYMTGSWPLFVVDHINGVSIPNFNKWDNLRQLTNGDNNKHRVTMNKNNKSGYRGVTLHKCGKYSAQISLNGKTKHLGLFQSAEDASMVYENARLKYYIIEEIKKEDIT